MSEGEVKVLDCWVSPFAMRVKIALSIKGVDYETQEEDLEGGKSELLLKSNPIYKKVPVLLHNGKAICESAVIVNYIEQQWPTPALLPPCAYGKSQAWFWSDYADKKLWETGCRIRRNTGEEQEEAKKDFFEVVRTLEEALGDNEFFSGDGFGFTDLFIIAQASWFPGYELYGNFKLDDKCPKLSAWMKRCFEVESVAKVMPAPSEVCEYIGIFRKMALNKRDECCAAL